MQVIALWPWIATREMRVSIRRSVVSGLGLAGTQVFETLTFITTTKKGPILEDVPPHSYFSPISRERNHARC